MLRHSEIWRALDRLAAKHGLSASGLARRAGLDPTAFNKSKRKSPTGKPRWPSTESVSKCLTATGESLGGFLALIGERSGVTVAHPLPLTQYTKAGGRGLFDDSGHPVGKGWDEIDAPGVGDPNAFALKIGGNTLAPAYRAGDIVIVSPDAGRIKVAERYAQHLDADLAFIYKRRPKGVDNVAEAKGVIGEVEGRHCVLIDDMIDTAGTITKAADALFDAGAADVLAMSTHGVLSDPATDRLKNSRICEVVITNTLPLDDDKRFDKLTVLSIAPLIARAIREIFEDGSVTSLFDGNA